MKATLGTCHLTARTSTAAFPQVEPNMKSTIAALGPRDEQLYLETLGQIARTILTFDDAEWAHE